MVRHALITILLIICTSTLFPQEAEFNDRCSQAYKCMLSMQFNQADTLLEKERKIHPNNIYVPYLKNYIDFISLFVSQDRKLYDRLSEKRSVFFSAVEKLGDSSRYKKWMLGNMHLQWSLIKMIYGDVFSSALEYSRAYYLIKDNINEFPGFEPNKLSMGVLHVISGLVPEKYDWLLSLFSLEGDVEQGKKEISGFISLTGQYDYLKHFYPEALFYSGFIELNIHPDTMRLNRILLNTKQINDSVILLKFLELNILMKTGHNDSALALLSRIDAARQKTYPFPYLDYLHGECLLRSLKTTKSVEEYDCFLENFLGTNYKRDTWRKKAWAAFLEGDTTRYFNNLLQVNKQGPGRLEIDKEAYKEALEKKFPDKILLKARLLFDGGYYHEVVKILTHEDTILLAPDKKVQYVYRLGRTFDMLGEKDKAKKYYLQTIELGSAMDNYFAANAALKLAGIYENEGELIRAEKNYNLCLEMDFEPYRNSIRTRAKEGLKRVIAKQQAARKDT